MKSIGRFRKIFTLFLLWVFGTAAGCVTESGGPAQLAPQSAAPYAPQPYFGPKKRIAVIGLENKVRSPIPDRSWQLGEGLTEMLTTELFNTGRFIMVERSALHEIVKEQELGQTGLIQQQTAAKVGELLGAQILVAGAVTEFEEGQSGGSGGLGFQGLAMNLQTQIAHVGLDIRLVDSSTGQILKSQYAVGKARSTGIGFAANVQGVTFGSDAFYKTPLGQATRKAINQAVMFIISEMEAVPWTGRVITVKGGDVYVNAGANMNLSPGTRLKAYSMGEELIDPSTGLSLGSTSTYVCDVTLTQIMDKFSIGAPSGGTANLKRGDLLYVAEAGTMTYSRGARPYYPTPPRTTYPQPVAPQTAYAGTQLPAAPGAGYPQQQPYAPQQGSMPPDTGTQAYEGAQGAAPPPSSPAPQPAPQTSFQPVAAVPPAGAQASLQPQPAPSIPVQPTMQAAAPDVIVDQRTGLMWKEIPSKLTWDRAKRKAWSYKDEGYGGSYDWHIPSRDEMETFLALLRGGGQNAAAGNILGTYWVDEIENVDRGPTVIHIYVTVFDAEKGDFSQKNVTVYHSANKLLLAAPIR